MKSVVFKDRVKVYVNAGNGGDGCASFRREKYVPCGGPSGGDGGKGGHVYFQADKNIDSLLDLYFKPHQNAAHGGKGQSKDCHGRNGKDLYIKVPCGLVIFHAETDEGFAEILEDGETCLVAKGGCGGKGNCHFVTSDNRAPTDWTPGEQGESKTLCLELKIIADVGLVGFPNAGKSTLLNQLSDAHPKTAPYPFTTLNPVIGTVIFDDYQRLRVADIPGLIDGAHQGVGLGHDFLRHIERTKLLFFVIDMAGVDGRDPVDDYFHLRDELKHYKESLEQRPFLVVANKTDLPEAQTHLADFQKRTEETPLAISADQGLGIEKVQGALYHHFFPKDMTCQDYL